MVAKGGWPSYIYEMIVIDTEDTSAFDSQVTQNLVNDSLITKNNLDRVEIESRFHLGKHLGNPNIHMMAFFNADALSNTTYFHF
jgi:hypothetical protein